MKSSLKSKALWWAGIIIVFVDIMMLMDAKFPTTKAPITKTFSESSATLKKTNFRKQLEDYEFVAPNLNTLINQKFNMPTDATTTSNNNNNNDDTFTFQNNEIKASPNNNFKQRATDFSSITSPSGKYRGTVKYNIEGHNIKIYGIHEPTASFPHELKSVTYHLSDIRRPKAKHLVTRQYILKPLRYQLAGHKSVKLNKHNQNRYRLDLFKESKIKKSEVNALPKYKKTSVLIPKR